MKNAILLYGRFSEKIDGVPIVDIPECDPNNENNWMGWTKKELEKMGWHVTCPVIPKVWEAPYSEWEKALEVAGVNEDTVLVGLSAGAASCVHYITQRKKNIKKLILVAPARFAGIDHPPTTKDVYDFEINSDTQKQITNGTTIFVSNDDWPGILEAAEIYSKGLNADINRFEGRGHFSFLIKTFPELYDKIVES